MNVNKNKIKRLSSLESGGVKLAEEVMNRRSYRIGTHLKMHSGWRTLFNTSRLHSSDPNTFRVSFLLLGGCYYKTSEFKFHGNKLSPFSSLEVPDFHHYQPGSSSSVRLVYAQHSKKPPVAFFY